MAFISDKIFSWLIDVLIDWFNDCFILYLQLLSIVDEATILLNRHTPFPGKEFLEESTLNCLKLLDLVLDKQDLFTDLLRNQGMTTTILATPLDRLLMGINPRSRKADHLVNIAQWVWWKRSQVLPPLRCATFLSKLAMSWQCQSGMKAVVVSSSWNAAWRCYQSVWKQHQLMIPNDQIVVFDSVAY